MSPVTRAPRTLLLGCLLSACAQIASADITTQQRVAIEGIGGMSFANMAGTTTTIISGERSRTDSDMQLQSKIVRMLARGASGAQADIVRLDLDKIEHLDVAKKEYTETSFAQLREQMQQAMGAGSGQRAAQPPPTSIDDSKCAWSDPKADVRRTGEKATFAGFDAERLIITASQACTDPQSGQVCEFVLALDEWLAPQFASSAEALKFQRAYAQKLGLGTATTSREVAERAQAMFGRYQGIWGQIGSKTKDMKGYPIKTTFAFAVGGPQCQNGAQSSSASTANSGGSTTSEPSGATAIAGQIGGKIAGMFHKKSDNPPADADGQKASAPPAAAAPLLPPGMLPLMTMSSELLSVSTTPVDPRVFEIPADFKLKQN
jgi:hypothetical protein